MATALATAFGVDDIFQQILSYATVLDLRQAACTCKRWSSLVASCFDVSLIVVTISGSNDIALLGGASGEIVQRLKASAPRGKRKRSRAVVRGAYCWPTCLAWGPQGQLFVSQYKIAGVLEFRRSLQGFQYQRTLISDPTYTSPEGLVYAHGCLYVTSVQNATVTRLSQAGQVLEVANKAAHNQQDDPFRDAFWVLWGMCASPDKSRLYIAGHVVDADDGDYRRRTRQDTGRILRLDLESDGSFRKDASGNLVVGYYVDEMPPLFSDSEDPLELNRPSNPSFCTHGIMHVSSFDWSSERAIERRIYKLTCGQFSWLKRHTDKDTSGQHEVPCREPAYLGWLEAKTEDQEKLSQPWGVAFSPTGIAYVTSHHTPEGTDSPSILQLKSCGCDPDSMLVDYFKTREPRAWSCGDVTVLADSKTFQSANYVLPVDVI